MRKKKQKCSTCKNHIETHAAFSNILFIDVQPINDLYLPKMHLTSIPSIKIKGESYTLKGTVTYDSSIKHYIAYCHRNNDWFEYDDLSANFQKSTKTIAPCLLVFMKMC